MTAADRSKKCTLVFYVNSTLHSRHSKVILHTFMPDCSVMLHAFIQVTVAIMAQLAIIIDILSPVQLRFITTSILNDNLQLASYSNYINYKFVVELLNSYRYIATQTIAHSTINSYNMYAYINTQLLSTYINSIVGSYSPL